MDYSWLHAASEVDVMGCALVIYQIVPAGDDDVDDVDDDDDDERSMQ